MTSPTAHNKSILIIAVIAEHERCKKAVFDVMGASVTTDGDEDVGSN